MKVFRPTTEEFRNPIDYFDRIIAECAGQYGCVKVIPPESFKPPMAFDRKSKRKLPTRFQVLQELTQGKPFKPNNAGHTFAEFQLLAEMQEGYSSDYAKLERDYWQMVDNQAGDRRLVEYAADLPATTYGSCFGRHGQQLLDPKTRDYLEHPANLNNLFKQPNSLMQFPRKKDLQGINIPWLYIGMKFATFCWHYEDLMLGSVNYNHFGKPKLWYAIPSSERQKFERVVKTKIHLLIKRDPNILFDIITMINPAYLISQNVTVYRTLQHAGEFIVTLPGAYHGGFSMGFNCGEAVNFASKAWIDYGLECQAIYRKSREKIPAFPIEWVIIENIRHLDSVSLDKSCLAELCQKYQQIYDYERKSRDYIINAVLAADAVSKKPVYANCSVALMENQEDVAEDAHQCHFCTDYCFLSLIACANCRFQFCLHHGFICKCTKNLKVVLRYSDQDLARFEHLIRVASDAT